MNTSETIPVRTPERVVHILHGRLVTVPFLRLVAKTSAGFLSGETACSLQKLFDSDPIGYKAVFNQLWMLMETSEQEAIEEALEDWEFFRSIGFKDCTIFEAEPCAI